MNVFEYIFWVILFLREALCTLVGAKLNMFVRSFVRPENNHFLCLKNRGRDTFIDGLCLSVV